MKTIFLTLLLVFPVVFSTTPARALTLASDGDCYWLNERVSACYVSCAFNPTYQTHRIGWGSQIFRVIGDVILTARTLRARNEICPGFAYDGGACRPINVLLQRFCRVDPSTHSWVLKPIYRAPMQGIRK